MDNWKRIVLKFAGIGLGIGLGAGAVCLTALWWLHRPPKLPAWNTQAITAKYSHIRISAESSFEFYYTLKNNTDQDFNITDATKMDSMGRTSEGDLAQCTGCVELGRPVFIPPHESTQVLLTFKYTYPNGPSPDDDPDGVFRKQVVAFLKDKYGRLDGFVIYDHTDRFKIELPADWKK